MAYFNYGSIKDALAGAMYARSILFASNGFLKMLLCFDYL